MNLRVLYVVAYPQRMAGANRSLFELVTHIGPAVDAQVAVLAPSAEGPVIEAYRRAGVPVDVVPVGPGLSTFGKRALRWGPATTARVALTEALPCALRLARLVRARGIDVVHVNDPRGAALAGAVARLLGVPLVAHMHGERPFEGFFWRLFEILPDRLVAVSDAIQSGLSP